MHWDLFCRVIDNHGDLGVCWRLARDLAARGEAVRLWLDDDRALHWMAPRGAPGVQAMPWALSASATPSEVVIEAFGCDPPAAYVQRMPRERPAVWINLEYLSAEDYVERSHGLPSPQAAGPGAGLVKWFFYPGFNAASGGLLREPGLLARRAAFDRSSWLAARAIDASQGQRLVSLFCYPQAPFGTLLDALAAQPTLLLVPGDVAPALAASSLPAAVQLQPLPWFEQDDYDHLLWSCDLNIVRGEDSFVRAMWAAVPFLWHIYAQADGAHAAKLRAFALRFGADEVPGLWPLWQRFNGLAPGPLPLPPPARWQAACESWRNALAAQSDLTTRLLAFVHRQRSAGAHPG